MLQNPVKNSPKNSVTATYENALEWLFAQTRGGAPRSAERMRALLARLELESPAKVVHVVGTNGKGSVAAMLAAGYEAAGWRTGRFISPHIESFRERITVNGRWISEAEVLRFVRALPDHEPAPAFFELTLALALRHFARERVQVAVVEAGVGAEHDATRVLENVRSVVITNVGRDHLDTLGPTLLDVARDKADAIRPGVLTLTGATGEALGVITEVAARRGSPLFSTPHSSRLPLGTPARTPTERRNQQLVAATLRRDGLSEAATSRGLSATLPARAERFNVNGKVVLLDGAHNPDAARALLEHTLTPHAQTPFVLLFGALPKKLGAETLEVLRTHAEHTVLTNAVPGAASALQTSSGAGLEFVAEPETALETALTRCREGGLLVIAGSFYLAGRLRPPLKRLAEG